jgi:antitoxin component of RelBE/YafQ-DinJ toxin-antitoxin module
MIHLSHQTEALAQRLAEAQNVTVDTVVRTALQAQAEAAGLLLDDTHPARDASPEAIAARRMRIDQVVRDIAAMPILDRRSAREIVDDLNDV